MLTVFLGTYNRLDTLTRTLDSFRRLDTPHEIVIVDNGTDHPKCVQLLEDIAEWRPEVAKVYHLGKIFSMPELTDNFNVAVSDWHDRTDNPWFAVTDADICFDGTRPDALDVYMELAEETGCAVGPHTRVDEGIPAGYPLRSRVLACESRLLYSDSMDWMGGVPYSAWPIDTTFHVFPRTDFFRRLGMNTLRVGPPYDAMHLDWYVDVFNPTEENWIYITEPREGVGSWGRMWLGAFWKLFQESPSDAFIAVLMDAAINRPKDLNNALFILSWCFQNGIAGDSYAGEDPLNWSRKMLGLAIPQGTPYWQHEDDWTRMIYDNDFASLGWGQDA